MGLTAEGVAESRFRFAVTADHSVGRTLLYKCDDCEFSQISEVSILVCPECDGEARIAPHSMQPASDS